jgi:aminoglycoside phosphotransferase (APT) family kinase protein
MEAAPSRLPWELVPPDVRAQVDRIAGSPVTEARNQPGGYGPSLAARCRLADGRGVFVKAVSPDQNPDTPHMLRREIEVTAALPDTVPAARLIDAYDDGHWVAAVFEEIDGVNPTLPWRPDELARVLRGLEKLAATGDPNPVPGLRDLEGGFGEELRGWRRLAGGGEATGLGGWCTRHLDALAELESGWAEASAGTGLVHVDVRADNVLLTRHDGVVFVDWAHASVGAGWVDVVAMAPSVALQGGPTCEDVLAASRVASRAEPDAVTAFAAALGGYFAFQSRQPPPPGLPTVRRFQAEQAEVTVDWLRRRTGWS